MEGELWKDIDGFKGYQISNKGRVRSFHKFKAGKYQDYDTLVDEPHILDTDNSDDGNGYRKVMLRRNGKSNCRKIHRLVAEAFVPNPHGYDTVDHISNDKSDNTTDNLRWLPRRKNVQKAYKDGLHDERIERSKVSVILVDVETGEVKRFPSVKAAADFLGVHYTSLSHAHSEGFPIRGYWVQHGNGGFNQMQKVINSFPGYKYVSALESEDGKSHNMFRGVDLGRGGYSYSEPGIYSNVALIDIQSMHPSSIVALNYFGEYTQRFKDILDARIAIKNGDFDKARTMFDGKLAKYLDDESNADALAQALKIAINSCYGLTSANFENPMRDSRNVNNIVALRGALFMKTLLDDLQAQGWTVCHLKVDSMKIPNATPEIIKYCQDFAEKYGYNFAHEATYERICLIDKAQYVATYMSPEECEKRYGYVPSDNRKHFKKHTHPWTTTGDAFQHPYVFKMLFSGEPVEFEDMCEIKSVKDAAMYLDFIEELPHNPEDAEYELKCRANNDYIDSHKHSSKVRMELNPEFKDFSDADLRDYVENAHCDEFIGRVSSFFPVRPGIGGGLLIAIRNGKRNYVNGAKGYRWMESNRAKILNLQNEYDHRYFDNLIQGAIDNVNAFGSFDRFVDLTRPYVAPEDISPAYDDSISSAVPCGDGKYNTCMDCPHCDGDRCKRGYSLTTYIERGE